MSVSRIDLNRCHFGSAEGKGATGCFFTLVLLVVAIMIGFKIGPDYYSYSNLQSEVKTEVSRAGAHFFDDETIIKDVIDMARRNEIKLTRENIKIDRFAGQVFITVRYSVPQDIFGYQRIAEYEIRGSSYIGRL